MPRRQNRKNQISVIAVSAQPWCARALSNAAVAVVISLVNDIPQQDGCRGPQGTPSKRSLARTPANHRTGAAIHTRGFNDGQLVTSVYEDGVPDEMRVGWIAAVHQTTCNPVAVLKVGRI